jgi:hypothetical protein
LIAIKCGDVAFEYTSIGVHEPWCFPERTPLGRIRLVNELSRGFLMKQSKLAKKIVTLTAFIIFGDNSSKNYKNIVLNSGSLLVQGKNGAPKQKLEGRWEMGDDRWEMGDGRWQMEDGRWLMADGRW